ncbi:YaaA family protein [Microbacterium aurantiacum]|uniref:Peroxide stress protein YaaA n=1 Tax=Microbacterium aurantiacum TaxID=162393 RepID=A0ABT8FQP5_9MICO|nr:peroxide stress protein YaaA [Microbacterium aurantiacum]MDN4463646.1 peroxide stress protein YaaA [Microbacterium aurantiacum]
MLILLPPSETKRSGGRGASMRPSDWAHPGLLPQRAAVAEALIALSADAERAAAVLGLGPRQLDDIPRNAELASAPTMSAVDRYTGVLFDALDAASLPAAARRWLGAHVQIHSAPFGPVGALDPIPAYRLGASAALPGLAPLKRVWADAVSTAIAESAPRFLLDLRSQAYVGLGPIPAEVPSAYVRVVSAGPDGVVRALNHFNKRTKGELVRDLAQSRPRVRSRGDFLAWAEEAGWDAREDVGGEILLVARHPAS